ncbi:hypothetical protein CAN33_0032935 [Aspergillus niger]|uniref:Interferon-related developmental regulator N-terminal domain-containing protein n=1 Tax=Aspergillus niger TaxID=5061 RepID=A0A505HZD2_ASPNG|nr:hypothetical protein CAN33_0032935 [Aspergillus niger]
MPDLRRQVLESGKTISRKAASREGSRRTSRANSTQNSRHSSQNQSRHASDEEDLDSLSDDTAMSIGSLDDLTDNPDLDNHDWVEELGDVIEDILDRKRSSNLSREEAYAAFCRLAKYHYVEEQIRGRVLDLVAAFNRSIKFETSVRETTLALRAVELLAISAYDNTIYEHVEPLLTRTVRDSTSNTVKAAAIHCLGVCTIHAGASEDGILDQMTFFLDIAASDGQSIGAGDDAASVVAALQEWGVLATYIDDLEGESEDAVQIFMDQLNSRGNGPKLIKRYNAYHNTHELEQQLHSLAKVHSKRISKRDKKSLHSNFASILTTVENPRRGPMYNTAIDQDTNRHYGSKLTVKIGRQGVMNIDRWWKWTRLSSLRRTLQGGFAAHYYQGNRAVLESLPVIMRMDTPSDRGYAKRTAKHRDSRRWAVHEASDED